MRRHFSNKWPLLFRAVRIGLIFFLIALLAGYLEFLQYARVNNIEWAGEGSDAYLVFDSTNLADIRLIFISHTPFGERMQNELLLAKQIQSPSLLIEERGVYRVAAPSMEALHKKSYLDNYAIFHLQAVYFFNTLRRP